jgi:carbon monoxide dehydrogenase subunit G
MEVERLALCLPGCEDVRRLSDDTFRARVKVKLGPFSTSQGMTVRLTETDPPRHLVSEGESDDSLMGGKVRMKMTLDLLTLGPEETRVTCEIDLAVPGGLGVLGGSLLHDRAKVMSAEFGANVKAAIEEAASHG